MFILMERSSETLTYTTHIAPPHIHSPPGSRLPPVPLGFAPGETPARVELATHPGADQTPGLLTLGPWTAGPALPTGFLLLPTGPPGQSLLLCPCPSLPCRPVIHLLQGVSLHLSLLRLRGIVGGRMDVLSVDLLPGVVRRVSTRQCCREKSIWPQCLQGPCLHVRLLPWTYL